MAVQSLPVRELPALNMQGLQLSNDATSPNSVIRVAAGVCRDSSNSIDLRLGADNPNLAGSSVAAPLSVDMAVRGANGLDQGSVAASTVYAVYLIGDSKYYEPVAAMFSLASNASPLLPAGYDSWRVIGYVATDGSSNLQGMSSHGSANDRTFMFNTWQATALTAGTSTAAAPVALGSWVPPVENAMAIMGMRVNPSAAGDAGVIMKRSTDLAQVSLRGAVASVLADGVGEVMVELNSGAPRIHYLVSPGGTSLALFVSGFKVSL